MFDSVVDEGFLSVLHDGNGRGVLHLDAFDRTTGLGPSKSFLQESWRLLVFDQRQSNMDARRHYSA